MQANKNINLWEEKAPVYRLSRSKAPKTQQICHYRHTRKTGEIFLFVNTGIDFSLRNYFANTGSFAKVSIPVHIYKFPCLHAKPPWSCLFTAENRQLLHPKPNFVRLNWPINKDYIDVLLKLRLKATLA